MKTSSFQSIFPVLARLHWLPVQQRIDLKISTLVYKWFTGCASCYFSNHLSLTSSTRLASGRLLHIPLPPKRNFGDDCFSIYAPKIWNALPSQFLNADYFSSFRSLLKTVMFRAAFLMWCMFENFQRLWSCTGAISNHYIIIINYWIKL